MKKLYGMMLVLYTMGLFLSSGVALGSVDTNATQNLTDTNSAVTDTSTVMPTVTDTSVVIPTVTATELPVVTETAVPITTPKSPGFEMVLTIGVLSAIYILSKFGKRR